MAGVRAEMVAARSDVLKLTRLLETNEKEWTTKLNAERERSDSVARNLAAVRAELADRIAAEAAARKKGVQSAGLLEATEKELTTKLNAEKERSDGTARDLPLHARSLQSVILLNNPRVWR